MKPELTPEQLAKRKSLNKKILIGIAILIAFIWIIPKDKENKSEAKSEPVKVATHKDSIDVQFSKWDGSHINLERYIKKQMNDPSSYEHDETNYWDMKTYLVVVTSFRGKNAFGGIVKQTIKAKVDMMGNVEEIMN